MAVVVGNWGGGAVWRITSGVFSSNAYFCEADVPGGGFLIDAGLDGATIDAELSVHNLRPHQVFCTPGHFDHASSASFFQDKYGCDVFLHHGDKRTLKDSNFLLMLVKIAQRVKLAQPTFVDDAFAVVIQGETLRYLPSPGHTPGSCVIEFGSAWFTGDTLYCRGVGLSKLPGENAAQLKASIGNLWDGLTETRIIYPGHGGCADGATVRRDNAPLRAFLGLDEGGR